MSHASETRGASGPWAEYSPSPKAAWDLRRVLHLHRRAGFAPTWSEIQRDLADGPRASIDRLLKGHARAVGVPANFTSTAELLASQALTAGDAGRLKAWWIYRMLLGPDPLGERTALLWHNHFATSNQKVADLAAMRRQNELFRRFGRGSFETLFREVVHDPALLIWLDAVANRKEHPNENLAREVMELFTLGVGRYTEVDVKEAARALTGWSLTDDGAFTFNMRRHDGGEKLILGRRGCWTGDDLLQLLLKHPATAERLADRLCGCLLGEGTAKSEAVSALADGLRSRDLDLHWAIETVLRSQTFFAPDALGTRVVGPVEFVVNAARALELFDPPPSTLILADWAARLGQDLFYPPNVGGWPGGRSWITTRSALGRAQFAAALVGGARVNRPPFDALALPRRYGRGTDLQSVIVFYAELLQGRSPPAPWCRQLAETLAPKGEAEAGRRAVAVLLAAPESQLC